MPTGLLCPDLQRPNSILPRSAARQLYDLWSQPDTRPSPFGNLAIVPIRHAGREANDKDYREHLSRFPCGRIPHY